VTDEEDAKRSQRRRFFREGLAEFANAFRDVREAVGDVVEEIKDAASEALPDEPVTFGGRSFHRSRRRQTGHEGEDDPAIIRPPGAVSGRPFHEVCTRCHRCVDACPEDAIVLAGPSLGPHQELTPLLYVEQRPCVMCADVPCASACPSGALMPLALSELKLGTLIVSQEHCVNNRGETCQRCADICPVIPNALSLSPAGEVSVSADRCTGCGQCVAACISHPKTLALVPL
jgi:ferredoxin-type protein NapG